MATAFERLTRRNRDIHHNPMGNPNGFVQHEEDETAGIFGGHSPESFRLNILTKAGGSIGNAFAFREGGAGQLEGGVSTHIGF